MKIRNKLMTFLVLFFVLLSSVASSVTSVVYAETIVKTNTENTKDTSGENQTINSDSQALESEQSTNASSGETPIAEVDFNSDRTVTTESVQAEQSIQVTTDNTEEVSQSGIQVDSTNPETEMNGHSISDAEWAALVAATREKSATIPEFIKEISELARSLANSNDLYASVMIAQAILESQYGQSELGRPPVHNLFGVKGMYNGQSVMKDTTEYVNGVPVIVKQQFRKYPSYTESLQDYVNKLKKGPGIENGSSWNPTYYSGAWRSNTKIYQDATKFLTGKYATDPAYNQKLDTLIQTYQLTQYDGPASKEIITNLEAPEAQATVSTDKVVVKGWALSSESIQKVEVSLNEQKVGNADYGKQRTDVYNAYPQYNNTNAGYEYTLDTRSLPSGENAVKVKVMTASGQTKEVKSSIVVPTAATNLNTIFVVDTLKNNQEVMGNYVISGWALSGTPVSKIEVLVDNKLTGNATIGQERLDVSKTYPQYKNPNSGYSYTLDTGKLTEGKHTVTVRMTNGVGTTDRTFSVVKPTVQTLGIIDEPTLDQSIYGTYKVRGWSLASEKVAKVEVQVDNNTVGNAAYGIARPDVYNVYSKYNEKNSGFEYNLDTTKLTGGKHTLIVKSTTASGKVFTMQKAFTIPNRPDYLIVDTLKEGTQLTNNFVISGWALSQVSVNKIEILVDNKVLGNATMGIERLDVNRIYPQYNNTNAGYSYQLDLTKLTEGKHSLTVRMTTASGTIVNRTYNVTKPAIKMVSSLDSPVVNEAIKGTYKVRGWSLASEKIASIAVLVDNKVIGNATSGLAREDVYRAFPSYNEKNSGYEYILDTTTLTAGSHTLAVRTTTASGKTQTNQVVVQVSTLNYLASLDTPRANGFISKNQLIKGWVLNRSALKSAEILINGAKVGNAVINVSRPDVDSVYPQYNNANSGYELKLNNQALLNGSNQLTINFTFADGSKQSIATKVNYSANLLPLRGALDEPSNNNGVGANNINVKGWFLAEEGIDKIEVYLDNIYKGNANYGQLRTDVANTFPAYKNNNSGFSLNVATPGLAAGNHTVKVIATTTIGNSVVMETTFTKGSLSGKKIFVDAGHGGSDPGAVSNGVQEKVLNLNVALKVQRLLQAQGAEVVMSRTGDSFLPLSQISSMANASNADIFISLHHNSAAQSAYGIETYSYASGTRSSSFSNPFSLPALNQLEGASQVEKSAINPFAADTKINRLVESQKLAQKVQTGLVSATGAYDRGAKQNDFHVIRETNMPAILAELGFITNNAERAKLVTDAYQNQLANGILNGVKAYYAQ